MTRRPPGPATGRITGPAAGPAAVLVPGLGLDGRAWAGVRAGLGEDVRTVLLPGHGRPAPRGTDVRVPAQARRLLERLAACGSGPVVLVGHSASCPVVVEAAAGSPDVRGLVLVGPTTDPHARTWPRMVGQWLFTAAGERVREVPVLIPQYRATGAAGMLRAMDAVRRYRTDEALAGLDLPVVVVRGTRDVIARAGWSQQVATSARGRLLAVQGAAHMVPLTHPEAVVQAVRAVTVAAGRTGGPAP